MHTDKFQNAEDIQTWMTSKLAELIKVDVSEVDIEQPLEEYGLDSATAMLLVTQAEQKLGFQISPTLLWHYPSISALSGRLAEDLQDPSEKKPQSLQPAENDPSTPNLAAEAVLDETIQPDSSSFEFTANPANILVTGGTGFLGAFLIQELLEQTNADIYCLVRAGSFDEGKERLTNKFQAYQIWDEAYESRVIPVLGDLSQPLMGMTQEAFDMLATNVDVIYHSAALLNYVYPYSALKNANVLGTQEVLRLASSVKVKPVHYVSSVAVFESPYYAGKVVKENDDFDHWEGIFLGYSQTKWVAEKLVKIAGDRGLPITIHRPPLIAGHSETGVCNTDDFINLMIKGCVQMGVFPDVKYMSDGSPVDYVSKSIVYLSRQPESLGKAFNLQHPDPKPITEMVEWLQSVGFPVDLIPYEKWQEELVNNLSSPDNPLYTLRPFLLERWSEKQLTIPDLYLQENRPIISCQETLDALAGSGIVCPEINSKLFMTYSSYLMQTGFLEVL
ncbi:MAG: thioester reductase domain-containing protein [Cyanobacteria bacterium P01_A01_bin.80]